LNRRRLDVVDLWFLIYQIKPKGFERSTRSLLKEYLDLFDCMNIGSLVMAESSPTSASQKSERNTGATFQVSVLGLQNLSFLILI
jgi:hypothetical protein